MDNTKLAADLCAIIDRMNVIIQAQAMELAQSTRSTMRRRSRRSAGTMRRPLGR